MHDIDPRAFLALIHLARNRTDETLAGAREHYPDMTEEDLVDLATHTQEVANRGLLTIAVKVAPTRKVDCWSQDGSVATAILECGHVTKVKVKTTKTARCRRCLEEENRGIVENLSNGQAKPHSGRT